MRRRDFVGALGAAVFRPMAGRAQEMGRVYRIAYLGPQPAGSPIQAGFITGLAPLGFVEGKNLAVDFSGAGTRPGQYTQAAQALVAKRFDLIVCGGPEAGRAAKQATHAIPLLVNTDDMVGEGLTASIAHPGGNITGVSIRSPELDGKRFEILRDLLPNARRIDALAGKDTANERHFEELRAAARTRGVELTIRPAGAYDEIAPAIEAAKAAGAAGLNVLGSALLFGNRQVIFERTAALALPAIYQWPENAREGGLMGYGPSIMRIYGEQLPRMAARLLRGAAPADLPVELPDRFLLVINLRAARKLGVTVPQSLLIQSDEVIE